MLWAVGVLPKDERREVFFLHDPNAIFNMALGSWRRKTWCLSVSLANEGKQLSEGGSTHDLSRLDEDGGVRMRKWSRLRVLMKFRFQETRDLSKILMERSDETVNFETGVVRPLFPLWRLFLGGSFVWCCAVCLFLLFVCLNVLCRSVRSFF